MRLRMCTPCFPQPNPRPQPIRRLLLLSVAFGLVGCLFAPLALAGGPLPPFKMDSDLPADIVRNSEQGLGQCHYLNSSILAIDQVSWAYDASEEISGWATVEPQPGSFDWGPLDAQVTRARSLDRSIWLELLTTEGQTPQWARDAGVQLVGSRGGTPVPWNPTYQTLLRRAVHAMAARYDDDPTVDAINLMAGGCYGEMAICAPQVDRQAWEQAGYTDEVFVEAVKQLIDIYLEEEYTWEDGTKTHGFLHTPVVLQLGSGLYGHTTAVIRPVVDYAVPKYGMRVWLKYNGLGGSYDAGWIYQEYDVATRVGYEPAGNSLDLLNKPKQFVRAALDQHASYLCLQEPYFGIADPKWQEARDMAAQYLGTQVVFQGLEAPASVEGGREYSFITLWVNRGTMPLVRPRREGVKDLPASYDILLSLVDAASGSPALEFQFTPAVPTTEWYSAQPIRIEQVVPIPPSTPAGAYDVRVALLNPNLPWDQYASYFHLVNTTQYDGRGRYTVGQITVQPSSAPTATATAAATPTPTPTPAPAGNWLTRLLNSIWNWLRGLFGR